jgi:hypothetical protein
MDSAAELLETRWRVKGKSDRPIECGIYKHPAGVELRAGYSVDVVIATQVTRDIVAARKLGQEWLEALVEAGYTELQLPSEQ